MIGKLFKRYKQGGRTISAKDLNKRAHILEAVAKATYPNGMYDSTGVHGRTQIRPKINTLIGIYEVTAIPSGDGLYTCKIQKLLNAEWDDTAGDQKIANLNDNTYTVLNLAEFNPEPTYVAQLSVGDVLVAWSKVDDEGITRLVGIPLFENRANNIIIRSAKIQSSGIQTTYLQCKLLDKDDAEEGSVINVYMRSYIGTAGLDLTGDVWPKFNAGDKIAVRLDLNGTWYFDGVVDETTIC